MDETGIIKRRIRKALEEDGIEIDSSDIPVHEKFVKEEHIKKIRRR